MDGVQSAGTEVENRLVDLRPVVLFHPVQVGQGLAVDSLLPVVGKALHDDLFVDDPVFVAERPGAAPLAGELVVTVLFLEAPRDESALAACGGEGIDQARRRVFQVDGDRLLIKHVDAFDLFEVRGKERFGVEAQPLDVPLCRRRVEPAAVMELNPLAEGEEEPLFALLRTPFGGEAGNQLEFRRFGIDHHIDEAVVHPSDTGEGLADPVGVQTGSGPVAGIAPDTAPFHRFGGPG